MRPVHWFFVTSVLLFVAGIGFVIAGARAARTAPDPAPASMVTPIASVKQIMNAIVEPSANNIFDAVITVVSVKGIEERAPQTDEEWEAVGNSAAALIESGNLMLLGSRTVDQGDWVKYSQAMVAASTVALKAAQDKSPSAVLSSVGAINASCDSCHMKYQRGS